MSKCYALYLSLTFPEGLSAASGSDYNVIRLARDGKNRVVLRGTSLTGVLRHEYARNHGTNNEKRFFGTAEGDELYARQSSSDKPSLIEIPDCVLEFSGTQTDSCQRTHHLRNRHTGTVLDKGLFSIQSSLPGATCGCVIWLNPCDSTGTDEISEKDAESFLREIASYFDSNTGGLLVGGNTARGVGRAVLNGRARLTSFELSEPVQYERYLDCRRKVAATDKDNDFSKLTSGDKWTDVDLLVVDKNRLTIKFTLTIPRGQDILVADGQGSNAGMEPQRVVKADGKTYWRLPGSTLRGLFRTNITHLAARAGKTVADSADLYETRVNNACPKDQAYTGENLAWAFMKKQIKSEGKKESFCAIVNLFGSAFQHGRIHVSDSFCLCEKNDQWTELETTEVEQYRVHLKIDPISGGNADGALFNNTVLTCVKQPKFNIVMSVDNPTKEECAWIVATIRALNAGILRVGSSKASGRMAVSGAITVNGHNWTPDEDILQLFQARENEPSSNNEPKVDIQLLSESELKAMEKPVTKEQPKETSYIGYVTMNLRGRLPQKEIRYENIKQKPSNEVPPSELQNYKPNDRIRIFVDADNKYVHVESASVVSSTSIVEKPDNTPVPTRKENQTTPDVFKTPFFNPYTFIPFNGVPIRKDKPTQRTADEIERDRVSGYIDMEIETLRPLMSLLPRNLNPQGVAAYKALTIGNDVIVPSTSIRGSLRSLMMILTGGALGNLNSNAYACQGRDCQLGPVNPHFADKDIAARIPKTAFLAKVISPGNANKDGVIRVGKCKLVQRLDLIDLFYSQSDLIRYDEEVRTKNKKCVQHLKFHLDGDRPSLYDPRSGEKPWELKLSGKPINNQFKRDGLYQEDPDAEDIVVPANLWVQYSYRNITGTHPTLFKGDLIWLEHADGPNGMEITKSEDIKSLQWARWGRSGDRLFDLIKPEFRPDTSRKDKRVDWITDLFGQVSDTGDKNLPTFAGRIRPENLVFEGGKNRLLKNIQLVPMSMPHPGCIGFYRDPNHLTDGKMMLRGYKVYRTALESEEPWKYSEQGIYDDYAALKPFIDVPKMNRTVELLAEKSVGRLRIAFQGLNEQELGILYKACSTIWRLGGGKPLGLGLCQTKNVRVFLLNDDGTLTEDGRREYKISDDMKQRLNEYLKYWEASQLPVPNMRYPRAVSGNEYRKTRGGHVWFARHAKVSAKENRELEGLKLKGEQLLKLKLPREICEVAPQWLPEFDPTAPDQDSLFGYDLFCNFENVIIKGNRVSVCTLFELFDPKKHITGDERSEGNFSQNRETRNANKEERGRRSGE